MYSCLSVFIIITAHDTEINIIFGISEDNYIDLNNFYEKKIPSENSPVLPLNYFFPNKTLSVVPYRSVFNREFFFLEKLVGSM